VESLIVFAQQKIKLNLNSRWLVIFVLRLAKPLSENCQRFRSAKVKVTQCQPSTSLFVRTGWRNMDHVDRGQVWQTDRWTDKNLC